MPLVLEDGTGIVVGANSYADDAEAVAYLTDRNREAAWNAFTPTQREAALVGATDYIDTACDFKGVRLLSTQPLAWPREGLVDDRGEDVPNLPVELKLATIELAIRQVSGTELLPDREPGAIGQVISLSEKVGPISESTTYSDTGGGPNSQLPVFYAAKRLLRNFTKGSITSPTSRVIR